MIGAVFKEQIRDYYARHYEATKYLQPDWLLFLRERAFHSFYAQDFPTKKSEAWKYTSLARFDEFPHQKFIDKKSVTLEAIASVGKNLFHSPYTFLFVNGKWSEPNKDATPGLRIEPLSSAWSSTKALDSLSQEDNTLFTALNTGFLEDGCFISVSPGVVIEAPVVLVFITDGVSPISVFPRVIIEMGAGAHLAVMEQFLSVGGAPAFTDAVTQIYLESLAHLNYYKIQAGALHISNTVVHQKADSRFLSFFRSSEASFVRNDLQILLQESGSEAHLLGLYSVGHKEHVDNHVDIKHTSAGTKSRTLYHGILDDEAKAVFNGKISVDKNLHGVDGALNNHNLLLSPQAEIDTKPELEIYSDDVKCAHGATVGALDEGALFYLRSRGIACDLAMEILKGAFMERVLLQIPDKSVATYLRGNGA